MSVVDNYVLKVGPGTGADRLMAFLNLQLVEEYDQSFLCVSGHAGGKREMEIDIWLLAANWINPQDVLIFLQLAYEAADPATTIRQIPNSVQLFRQRQDDPHNLGLELVWANNPIFVSDI